MEKIDSSESKCLLRMDKNGVATLTLNRPDKFNPLSLEMLEAMQEELDKISQDSNVRVVVLEAKGKAFCAGHDLKEMSATPEKKFYKDLFERCTKMIMTINRIPQPVIAKIEGIATAAGCQLVAACDLAVASDKVRFATSGIRYGLFCSTPAVAISRKMHRKKALEILLTGEFISAEDAEKQGLINYAVPADQLDGIVKKLTDAIITKSAVAVSTGKKMFYEQIEMNMQDAYDFAGEVISENMMDYDAQEGFKAFLEKREPVWNHGLT